MAAVAYVIVVLIGLWTIDISASAMIANKSFEDAGMPGGIMLTNGFRHTEPVQMYHYAMWLIIIANFAFMMVFIHLAIAHFKLKMENENRWMKKEKQ